MVKQHSKGYNSHFPPIAPAIAPRPQVQVLPKPIPGVARMGSSASDISTNSAPCIITSKQWVLPPRPKSGRKPSTSAAEKKKLQGKQPRQNSISSAASMTNLSNNLVSLNLNRSQSENMALNPIDDELKLQLDSATEENQKLKSIISRLKSEIDQLQDHRRFHTGEMAMTPPSSTPSASNVSVTPRELSPSTVDPKDIGMTKPRKRTYKKKIKKETESVLKSPSPLAAPVEMAKLSDLPAIEPLLDEHLTKRTKLTSQRQERSLSLGADLVSPPSAYMLDRSLSTPADASAETWCHGLSRTTTNTTLDPAEFGWPELDCGFCADGASCLCLEKHEHLEEQRRELMIRGIENNVINEGDEVEVFLKAEEEDYLKNQDDDFLKNEEKFTMSF